MKECLLTGFLFYLLWLNLSIYVYGYSNFYKEVNRRAKVMNIVNAYIYEITFMSIFLVMVLVDILEDLFFFRDV